MPHAKFYEHRTIKSIGEDFLKFLPYGHCDHLGHVT